jgi:hypothetical protein
MIRGMGGLNDITRGVRVRGYNKSGGEDLLEFRKG